MDFAFHYKNFGTLSLSARNNLACCLRALTVLLGKTYQNFPNFDRVQLKVSSAAKAQLTFSRLKVSSAAKLNEIRKYSKCALI